MKGKKVIVIVLGIVILASGFHHYWKKSHESVMLTYEIYNVKQTEELTFEGKVEAMQQQEITVNEEYGTIKKIHVKDGDQVKAGEVLITCSGNEKTNAIQEKKRLREEYENIIAKINEQKNMVLQSKSEAENEEIQVQGEIENLDEESTEVEQTLNELKVKLEQIQKKKKEEENKLIKIEKELAFYKKYIENVDASINTLNNSNTIVLTADFDGIVRLNESGKTDTSVPIIKVYSDEHKVNISVTEYDIEKIEEGQKVNLLYVNKNKTIEGTIHNISYMPDENIKSIAGYEVSIIPNEDIHLGYTIQVSLSQDEIYVPEEVVIREENSEYVYKFINGKAVRATVVCEHSDGKVRIIDGLENGDSVILNPKGVKDQMEVKTK